MFEFEENQEAKLFYYSGKFDVVDPGLYVRCAVTDKKIFLENLRYWDPELQEAYSSAEVCFQKHNIK